MSRRTVKPLGGKSSSRDSGSSTASTAGGTVNAQREELHPVSLMATTNGGHASDARPTPEGHGRYACVADTDPVVDEEVDTVTRRTCMVTPVAPRGTAARSENGCSAGRT